MPSSNSQWPASVPPSSSSQNIHSRHPSVQSAPYSSQAAFSSSLPHSYQQHLLSSRPHAANQLPQSVVASQSTPEMPGTTERDPPHTSKSKTGFADGVGFDAATFEEQHRTVPSASKGQQPLITEKHVNQQTPVYKLHGRADYPVVAADQSFYIQQPPSTAIASQMSGFRPYIAPNDIGVSTSSSLYGSTSSHPSSVKNGREPIGLIELPSQLGGQLGVAEMTQKESNHFADDFEDEAPLLEELGINPDHIAKRMKAALLFYRLDHDLLIDVDMCGPLFIAGCLGCSLLLSGKIHFAYIYGLSVTSVLCMCILLNLMSQQEGIDLYRTTSILGYGLLPVDMLAFLAIFFSLRNFAGTILSVICVTWCTAIASRFFETALLMHHQRFLIAYPVALIYACFVLITVF